MAEKLLGLPIGTQDFEKLRRGNKLYVDKTEKLLALTQKVDHVFLSRPRRFGKSLTLSTLEAMYSGDRALFDGLHFGEWLKNHDFEPAPVLSIDMGGMNTESPETLKNSLSRRLRSIAEKHSIRTTSSEPGDILQDILERLNEPAVLLIDEYDKPILDSIGEPERLEPLRRFMQNFYSVVKSCDRCLRFLMLTGISKFSRLSVFSAMNNLLDISMNPDWGDLVGCTQAELEANFSDWIGATSAKMGLERAELLDRMKDYYVGSCFDGVTRLYNPFSILSFFAEASFREYWYGSGTPSFIAAYLKRHAVSSVDQYRHIQVGEDFTSVREIDAAPPESFLYQAGYLTIEKREGPILTLDYPNKEVLSAISRTFLDSAFNVYGSLVPGVGMVKALQAGDLDGCMKHLNGILSGIASELFRDKHESTYSAIFTSLLRGAGADCESEANSSRGRCDLKVKLKDTIYVVEFKLARPGDDPAKLLREAQDQIRLQGYAEPHAADPRSVIPLAVVFDAVTHSAVLWG